MEKSNLVCVGVIMAPHGIKGEVKVKPLLEVPKDLLKFSILTNEKGDKKYKLNSAREIKDGNLIVRIEGIDTRTQAEELIKKKFYTTPESFNEPDEEEFYYRDLINLKVVLKDGSEFGIVKSVQNFGAGDLLEITLLDTSKTEFFSFTKEVVPEIHINKGYIVLEPQEATE
jgi:16S rRNA processing protein RimM